jgi:hypothetical protein
MMEFPRDHDEMSRWADEAAEKWEQPDYGDVEVFSIEHRLDADMRAPLDPFLLAQMGGLITVFAACRMKARWERAEEVPTMLQVRVEVVSA